MTNPLLNSTGFPAFDEIKPEHVLPALKHCLTHYRNEVEALTSAQSSLNWSQLIRPLESAGDAIDRVWSPVSHLSSVADSDELREIYQQALPLLSEFGAEMGQHAGLFKSYQALQTITDLNDTQKNALAHELRDFRLSGIDLSPEDQQRYKELSNDLSQLGNEFSDNVLDATEAWQLDITDKAIVETLPEASLAAAAQAAKEAGVEGWRFSLHAPSYIPFMNYCAKRELREQMYTAFVTRASEHGPNAGQWDNKELMQKTLAKRHEMAVLLGFENYAAYSLATKMADDAPEVERFLLDLGEKAKPAAETEYQEVLALAQSLDGLSDVKPWDLSYYGEKLRLQKYALSSEQLRPYFPLPKVLNGLFTIVEKLFGIRVEAAESPSTWHDDVSFFALYDNNNKLRGHAYLDLFARKGKRGGAWMADCTGRRLTEQGVQTPVAFLVCNFMPPVGETPSLLTHDDVVTLFHEFGHGLHHMLTQVDVASVAGINGVAWDAVELPSQFLENWCWQPQALETISGHVETGDSIPADLLENMLQAKNFQSALHVVRQVEFALFDIRMHQVDAQTNTVDIEAELNAVRAQVSVVPAVAFNRFANGFSHIFAGGYAAGYYSYLWAEVLSADAFSRFEEEGIFNSATGQSFLTNILEKGGSQEPMTLFKNFRGRAPSADALLRHAGLNAHINGSTDGKTAS